MNNATSARIYFLFTLFLLLVAYKITTNMGQQIKQAHAQQAAQIERIVSSIE